MAIDRAPSQGPTPYVVATPTVLAKADRMIEGRELGMDACFDPRAVASAPLLDRIADLDEACFAPTGMTMPRWALYDCGELPGAVVGLASTSEHAPTPVRTAYPRAKPGELLPWSMVIAIPTLEEHQWLLHTVAAVPGLDAPPVLWRSLHAARAFLRARQLLVTTQWGGDELDVLVGLGEVAVIASYVEAHDRPATCLLRIGEERAASGSEWSLDANDEGVLIAFQERLEAGATAWLRRRGPDRRWILEGGAP